jgi:hypothetical protein
MPSSGLKRCVAFIRTEVSKERNFVCSPLILSTVMMEAIKSSEKSVFKESHGVTT